jgi:hypothetical protein
MINKNNSKNPRKNNSTSRQLINEDNHNKNVTKIIKIQNEK